MQSKNIGKAGLFLIGLLLFSSCGLFKKKCDCPHWGKAPVMEKPETARS